MVTILDMPPEWDALLGAIAPCPAGCFLFCPVVGEVIQHLNDSHRWTREQIADFVATIERVEPAPSVDAVREDGEATTGCPLREAELSSSSS
jgi:hypothetical protein